VAKRKGGSRLDSAATASGGALGRIAATGPPLLAEGDATAEATAVGPGAREHHRRGQEAVGAGAEGEGGEGVEPWSAHRRIVRRTA
jgi:hypothetical protein